MDGLSCRLIGLNSLSGTLQQMSKSTPRAQLKGISRKGDNID